MATIKEVDDHVTSMLCVAILVKELIGICGEEGVDQVFVDFAHSIGCTSVDMKEIRDDFYTSNLHNWVFCPPSIAFLYTLKHPKGSDLHHPVMYHEYGNRLTVESAWIGTRDYSSQLVVPSILEFVNRLRFDMEGNHATTVGGKRGGLVVVV
ncbi:Pyridoxal phosphate-dependent transferase, major domain [Sesbania bispinosa]|nr:Pyridoxal phosphate-dependent transferase, major domain [Sesbania bispinosa]